MTLTLYFSVENQVFILRNETLDLYAQNILNLQKQIKLPTIHDFNFVNENVHLIMFSTIKL